MATIAPTASHNIGRSRFDSSRASSVVPTYQPQRPLSQAETDFEDDSSEFEEDSGSSAQDSFNCNDSRRQSQTTVSSYGEAQTPRSARSSTDKPFEVIIKPVEGPKGPHLFRTSQSSVEFMFDGALQMSPLEVEKPKESPRVNTALSQHTMIRQQYTAADALSRPHSTPIGSDRASVHHWGPDQVLTYMASTGLPREVVEKLRVHDISGAVLMQLEFDHLKELDIQSFGKRHQLWGEIQALKGGEKGPSPVPTPFQDLGRPCTSIRSKSDGDICSPCSACSDTPMTDAVTPISSGGRKKKKSKKHRNYSDVVRPGDSVSIVAIEQVIPKEHHCSKGKNCSTYRHNQRLLRAIRKEQERGETTWPISPTRGGHIMITGDPGNPQTAENILPAVRGQDEPYRPLSDVQPSVVASSDVLGPGQLPEFALHEDQLQKVAHRDAQENVKHFLHFQHVQTTCTEEPPTPPLEMFPAEHYQFFGQARVQPPPRPSTTQPRTMQAPQRARNGQGLQEGLKHLPKLEIPRSASAAPACSGPSRPTTQQGFEPVQARSATVSPSALGRSPSGRPPSRPYRFGTPASELDVPTTKVPVPRDASQSVPPDMQYRNSMGVQRSSSRAGRRPSIGLPMLHEDQVFSAVTVRSPECLPLASKQTRRECEKQKMSAEYGSSTSHAGWMKKRTTKLLRREWQDAHFRLRGTQLDMHADSRLSSALMDTIDVDEYSVAVNSQAANSKIAAALKSLKISGREKDIKGPDSGAFMFQLVPSEKDRAKIVAGKTHHFAVTNAEQRIDWMRELMLAKAKRQKDNGYDVELNGEQA